ncbi:hypothetical protein [Limnobacter sp.]|uniref:hypothetical protein n=1 Tax=Limnobacter sp. TaxID=2003368 RepID=UPI00311EF0D3
MASNAGSTLARLEELSKTLTSLTQAWEMHRNSPKPREGALENSLGSRPSNEEKAIFDEPEDDSKVSKTSIVALLMGASSPPAASL